MKKKTKIIIISLLIIVAVVSSFVVIREYNGRQKEKNEFVHLAKITETSYEEPSADSVPEESEVIFKESSEPESAEESSEAYDEEMSETTAINENQTVSYQPHSVQDLIDMNPDCFGWISIAGTNISYPVMHTPYDSQKYLHRSFYGEYSFSGVPFLDYRCTKESDNLIIYGHHMNDGSMFADLCNYADESYCKNHQVVILETENEAAEYQVFSVMLVSCYDDWYLFTDAGTDENYDEQIEYAKTHSLYDTGIVPQNRRQILSLSTCTNRSEDGRILVLAVKN